MTEPSEQAAKILGPLSGTATAWSLDLGLRLDGTVRTVPGRLRCGAQFFEAHIGCQLLPTGRFVDLLEGAGFRDVGVIEVTPVHVVVHGTK